MISRVAEHEEKLRWSYVIDAGSAGVPAGSRWSRLGMHERLVNRVRKGGPADVCV